MREYTCDSKSPQDTGGKQELVGEETGPPLALDQFGEVSGRRRIFPTVKDWVNVIGAGNLADAGPQHLGIFTRGQMNCLAVVLVEWDRQQWAKARMAHVGDASHRLLTGGVERQLKTTGVGIGTRRGATPQPVVDTPTVVPTNPLQFYEGFTDVAAERLWAVILSKRPVANREAAAIVKSHLPDLRDDHIWLYHGDSLQMQSAVSCDGLFGEPPT